jgi:enterochelin esterase family protein
MTASLLKRMKTQSTPLIDGNTATFIWRGRSAPVLEADFTGWDDRHPVLMEKISPAVWQYQQTFFPDAYIEYSFKKGKESLLDPNNPRSTPNGIGGANNYFFMPEYKPIALARKKRDIPRGSIITHSLSTGYVLPGSTRVVRLYRPDTQQPVPLVVVWDGQDYYYRIHLNYLVDNLIAKQRIRPLALAFVDNGGEDLRTVEYSCNDASLSFLISQVIPFAKQELNLVDTDTSPGAFGVIGASMGGLMALYTGVRLPHVFGNVLSQSGAFSWGNYDMVVYELLQQGDVRPIKIWMDAGIYDLAGLLEANRRMHALLTSRGYPVTYREYHAGHNFPSWRDDIWRGLEALYSV